MDKSEEEIVKEIDEIKARLEADAAEVNRRTARVQSTALWTYRNIPVISITAVAFLIGFSIGKLFAKR